jgi:DNA polymerase-3 subunit delta'
MLLSDIPSHTALKESFIRNIKAERVSHGQLFVGPNGFGGLALALGYLQYLYCTDKQEHDSCGKCSNCRRVSILEHPDVHFSFPIIKQGTSPETSNAYPHAAAQKAGVPDKTPCVPNAA